jgi:PAS domain S-box-containing protein
MPYHVFDKNLNFNDFDEIDIIALLIDPTTGNIIDANDTALDYYGYSRKEFFSMKIQTINQLTNEEVEMKMEMAVTMQENYFSFRHQLKNGEIRDVEDYSGPIVIKGKKYLFSFIYDLSDGKSKDGDIKDRIKKMDVIIICSFCHRIKDADRWIPSQLFLHQSNFT